MGSATKYIDYKIFEFFRDRMFPTIQKYRKGADKDVYKHIFLAPESSAGKHSFKLTGVKFPFVCLWTDDMPKITQPDYGRSVLFRTLVDSAGTFHRVRIVDYAIDLKIHSASYFKTFVGEVDQHLTEMDMIRGFKIPMGELIPNFVSVIHLEKKSVTTSHSVDEISGERKFSITANLDLRVTLPLLSNENFAKVVQLYVDDKLIYEFGGVKSGK